VKGVQCLFDQLTALEDLDLRVELLLADLTDNQLCRLLGRDRDLGTRFVHEKRGLNLVDGLPDQHHQDREK
jgi:hypothetical protein